MTENTRAARAAPAAFRGAGGNGISASRARAARHRSIDTRLALLDGRAGLAGDGDLHGRILLSLAVARP